MNQDRWQRVAAAVEAVLDAAENRRDSVLRQACADSDSLQADVVAMLRAHEAVAKTSWPPAPRVEEMETFLRGDSRFLVTNCLGEGGFGVVYRAWDNRLMHPVAIKQLRTATAEFLTRFKREFRALCELNHPGIVTVYELFVERGKAWFTMELIEGRPITDLGNLLPSLICDTKDRAELIRNRFRQLTEAVIAAHDAGFLHRDLKPSNVLVSAEERVTVLDFGLATDLRSLRDPHSMLCGTPLYMAPEQFGSTGALPESDFYSVGVMLCESLGIPLPFFGVQDDLLAQKVLVVTPPSELAPPLFRLASIAAALLHPDPYQRPSRDELMAALGARRKPATLPPGRTRHESSNFVGRHVELRAMCSALKRMTRGALTILRVHGSSGCGKTALISRFAELAQSEDPAVVVLFGRCRENESVGFRAVDTIVDALAEYLRRLPQAEAEVLLPQHLRETVAVFPALNNVPAVAQSRPRSFTQPDSQERQRCAFEGLRELLGRLAHSKPVVIIIDDLHWSDSESPALFRHLLRGPDAPPLLLIVAHRSDNQDSVVLSDLLASIREAATPQEMLLGPLSAADAQNLAARLLGEAHPLLESVIAESGGLPFLIVELAQHLVARDADDIAPPSSVGSLLAQQLRRLTPEARAMVELLTVARRPRPFALVARGAGLSGAEASDALRLLRSRCLATVSVDGTHLEIYHERIRAGICGLLNAERVVQLHQHWVNALAEEIPPDHDALTYHYHAAGALPLAAHHAYLAATVAEQGGKHDEAADYLRLLLTLDDTLPARQAATLRWLGSCLANAGRGPAAATAFLQAADYHEARSTEYLELSYFAAEQLIRTGKIAEGRALLEARLLPHGLRIPRSVASLRTSKTLWRTRAALYSRFVFRDKTLSTKTRVLLDASWLLAGNALMFDYPSAQYFQGQHLALTLESGEVFRVARAMGIEMLFGSIGGTRAKLKRHETLAKLEAASGLCSEPVFAAFIPIWRGIIGWLSGDFSACLLATVEAEQRVLEHGVKLTWELATARAFALASLVWQGRLVEYRERYEQLRADANDRGDVYAQVLLTVLAHAHIGQLSADAPECVAGLIENTDVQTTSERWLLRDIWAFYSQVETALYCGNIEQADDDMRTAWPSLTKAPWMRVQVIRIYLTYLRARTALACVVLQQEPNLTHVRVVRAAIKSIDHEQAPWATGLARILETSVARLEGTLGTAELIARIETAHRALESSKLGLFAFATRRALSVIEDRKSRGHLAALDSELVASGIRSPERFTRMLAPGLVGY